MTFKDFIAAHWPIGEMAPRTAKEQLAFVTSVLVPRFGALPLDQIRYGIIERLQGDARALGLSNASVNGRLRILHKILMHAARHELIAHVPAFPKALREEQIEVDVTGAELEAYLAFFDDPRSDAGDAGMLTTKHLDELVREAKPLFLVAARTGISRGDLLGLRWPSVDLVAGVISARRFKTGQRYTVPLQADALAALTALRARGTDGLVFQTRKGLPFSTTTIARYHARAIARAGIAMRFHDLRHLAITKLASSGVNAFLVREMAGHANISTSQRYCHALSPDAIEQMRRAL